MPLEKNFLLNKSEVFCIRPWVHLHINTAGEVLPCCISSLVLGDTRRKTIEEIWNGRSMGSFRKEMLTEIKNDYCSVCYKQERNGLKSMRQSSNETFAHEFKRVELSVGGKELEGENPIFWDIRFSNICNFRCRTCSHHSSSKWFDEALLLGEQVSSQAIVYAGNNDSLLAQLEKYVEEVEEIYFAGGEPLVMEEHYAILDLLLNKKKSEVRLIYNTNFSNLRYKEKNILEIWSQFKNVTVSVSLDASYQRAEYLRKEQKWEQVLLNLQSLSRMAPQVLLKIQTTVSAFNVFHITDFHREWIEKKYILPENIELNILSYPEHYNIQLLPLEFKIKCEEKLNKHIDYIKELELKENNEYKELIKDYEGILRYLVGRDNSYYFDKFCERVQSLDLLRNEKFLTIFPEFEGIYKC